MKVDGLDPNRTFTIPAGVGINKTLTIEKGPIKFQYDSIMLIFHAACDIDKENIADTVYVSAHFVPACNKATLQNPGDLWTSNNITGDTIPILIKDYNYNLEGFSNIQLKYKKTNTSIWSRRNATTSRDASNGCTPGIGVNKCLNTRGSSPKPKSGPSAAWRQTTCCGWLTA